LRNKEVVLAGPSPFADAWRSEYTKKILFAMPSGHWGSALHDEKTGLWSGFAPDYVKLMSADLGFAYSIIDLNELCDVELIEAYRAFFRGGHKCSDVFSFSKDKCCTTAADHYGDDLFLFDFRQKKCHGNATVDASTGRPCLRFDPNESSSSADAYWRPPELVGNHSHNQTIDYKLGFPFVRKENGEGIRVEMLLHDGIGHHHRTSPAVPDSSEVARFMAGTAIPCTPMYSEEVETLVYFQDIDTMWGLFTPFEWQLWVSIGCMVSAPSSGRWCERRPSKREDPQARGSSAS
jgi:hypothetical protein